mmetsp:Transcript_15870/g.30690  ORF Transcript_15870/g.30690 Transcript_15870/m.30690 type:complete len:281 (+) Transcript_15870:271-1113(+)
MINHSSNVEHTSLHEGSHSVENSISNDHRKGESGDVLADIAKTTTESLQIKPLELHPGEDDDSKRFKRKAKWRKLSARNEELESLRPVYLRRIAELEQEVDAYRMAGAINLQKENELFRVEIFKHKAFLANVTQAIQDTTRSLQATNSEHLRLITEVINSSISRIVGLVHMSTQWQRFDEIDHGSGLKMAVSLEFLPHGVLPRESKRINMRYEILHAPVSADNLHQILMSFWGNQDKVRSLYSAFDVSSTYQVNYIPMESPSLDEARKSLGGYYTINQVQ